MTKGTRILVLAAVVVAAATIGDVAQAGDQGDWMVRVRAILLSPDDSGTDGLATAEVKGNQTIEVDFTRFLTEHLALEAIAATSSQEVLVGGVSFGSVHHLPPTVTFQYHFAPDGKIRPYVGAGVNYTVFYDKTGSLSALEVDDSFGLAGQFGIDFAVGEKGAFNVDLKYIDLDTTVSAGGVPIGDLTVNPWVLGFGFGHRF